VIIIAGFSPFADQEGTAIDRPPVPVAADTGAFIGLLAKCLAQISEHNPRTADGTRAGQNNPNAPAYPDALSTPGSDTMKAALRFVLDHEGSAYVAVDGGESSRYGIRQSTAERFGHQGSVRNMSRAQAEGIYSKLWVESGAQALPPRLAVVHFDTYMNSPAAARRILRASEGDANAYLQMRSARYARLGQIRPDRYARYMKGWMNRIHDLRAMATAVPSAAKAPT
jgi:lysozyme family protein